METKWLTIELGEAPKARIVQDDREVLLSGYLPRTGFPGSTGHFDWLRSTAREIIGVRYWPFDDAIHASVVRQLLIQCRSLKYAVVDPESRCVSVFFGGAIVDVAENISNDQDLGENGIYENEHGGMALCFEVDAPLLDSLQVPPDSLPPTPRG
jgi:hypothetical protein